MSFFFFFPFLKSSQHVKRCGKEIVFLKRIPCMEKRPIFDIPLFHKVYALYKLMSKEDERIPKTQRYTLWQKCKDKGLAILERLIEIGVATEIERLNILKWMSVQSDLLKVLIRLAKELKAI